MMKKKTSNTSNSRFTEDWIPIKSINNGIVTTKRGEKIAGVKIQPNNIFIMERLSQENIIEELKNFYNLLDFEFWLIVTDKPVDINLYLSHLQVLYNETQDSRIRKLIQQDMDKGKMFVDNDVVDTEYFLLFKEKELQIIQKKLRMIINGLSNCRLYASEATNDDMRIIMDSFLNDGRRYNWGTVMPK